MARNDDNTIEPWVRVPGGVVHPDLARFFGAAPYQQEEEDD